MEPKKIRTKILSQIQHMVGCAIIKDRRFLDDEQLIRSEQLAVLEKIFNANVRDTEIRELSNHFAAILRGDHPCHLAYMGQDAHTDLLPEPAVSNVSGREGAAVLLTPRSIRSKAVFLSSEGPYLPAQCKQEISKAHLKRRDDDPDCARDEGKSICLMWGRTAGLSEHRRANQVLE